MAPGATYTAEWRRSTDDYRSEVHLRMLFDELVMPQGDEKIIDIANECSERKLNTKLNNGRRFFRKGLIQDSGYVFSGKVTQLLRCVGVLLVLDDI